MSETWAERFPITRGLPRGYLVLDVVKVDDYKTGTLIHPFTIMEYRSGSRELFDFVYAGVDTQIPGYRDKLERFFDSYKAERGRSGRYLLAGDMVNPLWDALYNSPAQLRQQDSSANANLELMEARVRERMMGGEETIEALLETLGRTCPDDQHVRVISQDVGIEPALWHTPEALARVINRFVREVVRQGPEKIEALIEVLALRVNLAVT
ncbi:MAG TPA: hypothetical protein VGE04_10490 [Chloroflexia bacterium]|jgi:hypothetical protein